MVGRVVSVCRAVGGTEARASGPSVRAVVGSWPSFAVPLLLRAFALLGTTAPTIQLIQPTRFVPGVQ